MCSPHHQGHQLLRPVKCCQKNSICRLMPWSTLCIWKTLSRRILLSHSTGINLPSCKLWIITTVIDQVVTSGKPCLGETELPQYGRLQLLCGEGCDQCCPGWKWFEKRVWERFLLMKDDWILILFISGWAEKVSQNKTVGESKCTASWSGLCKKTDQDGLLNAKKVLYTQKRVQSYKSRKCYYESAEMGSIFWSEYWSHFRKQSLAFNLMCICESDFVCNCALRLLHRNVAVIFNYNVPSASNEWVCANQAVDEGSMGDQVVKARQVTCCCSQVKGGPENYF